MRNMTYKVSFLYTINRENGKNETGELSETKMTKEEIVRMLIMFSPTNYENNLRNFLKLTSRGSYMQVLMNEGNESELCHKILKITK